MSAPRNDSDATLDADATPAAPPANDQTLGHDSLAPPVANDRTMAHDSVAPPPSDQTMAHDSVMPVDYGSVANEQTMQHDSVAPPQGTVRGGSGWREAGGVKLSLSSKAGSFVTPGVAPPPDATEEVPGYELLGELGRGAMGVVYKARQVGLKRVVALKMILSGGRASTAEISRFRVEAEAVARLQHPYIVQVFEIGEHKGLPYFSLEFVEGGCLADKIAENPLPLREAAALVKKLAEGMACAHENAIIHRDLKPANVLMTKEGDPKITDFGLAKKLEEDSGATRIGAIMGTPSYMAPEQAEGRNDLIGPSSDIYALGAILYDLITGRPPFRGATLLETLTQVRINDPVPPARLHPKMPRDLETITLKCLLKEPKKRYHTARDLAEDLRRFLAGEPILARPVSAAERAWKWCKRQPALAALIAVSVISLVGMAGGGVAYARNEARRAEEAESREKEVEKQRDRAEDNFVQARKAVDEMLSRVGQEQLGYEPKMAEVRRDLLEKAAKFYERFLEQKSTDPSVRHDVAKSVRRLGDARQLLGQNPKAAEAYRRSIELLDELAAEFPEMAEYRQDLAAANLNLGDMLRDERKFTDAGLLNARAVELFAKLAEESPGDAVRRRELAQAHYNRALLDRDKGKLADAADSLVKARKIQEKLPRDLQSREELARTYTLHGDIQKSSKPGEAEQFLREGLAIYEALYKDFPGNARAREGLVSAAGKLGDLLRTSQPAEAGTMMSRAAEIGRGLVDDFPTVPDYQKNLAQELNNLGVWQLAAGRPGDAKLSFQQALALKRWLADTFPRQADYRRDLARTEGILALQMRTAGLLADADPLFRRAVEETRKLAKEHPDSAEDQRELALALVRLASFDVASAEAPLREALALQDKLVKAAPASRENRAERARSASMLGGILIPQGRLPDAETLLARAEADSRDLASRFPDEPEYRFELALARVNQGELFRATNRPKESEAASREAEKLLAALAKQFPQQPRYAREQAKALHNLGVLLHLSKRHAEAQDVRKRALTLRQQMADQQKDEPAYRQELAQAHGALAVTQTMRSDWNPAAKNFEKAIELLAQLHKEQPAEAAITRDLAYERGHYAEMLRGAGRDDDAVKEWRKAADLRAALAKQHPGAFVLHIEASDAARQLAMALLEFRQWGEARAAFEEEAGHLREALKLAMENKTLPGTLAVAHLRMAEASLGKKDHEAAAKAVAAMPPEVGLYPVAAAKLALCAALADKDTAKGYGDRAVGLLREAVAAGFDDAAVLKGMKEFDAIRERDDFKKLLASMAKK